MGKQAKLNRQVFNKVDFNKTVNTEFTQLVNQPDPSFFDVNLATQEDFFILYNKFFYEIPKEGVVNSHTYLIQESSEYVNYSPQQEEIDALLQEIADLRQENLELRQEYATSVAEFGGISQDDLGTVLEEIENTTTANNINIELPTTTQSTTNTNTASSGGGRSSGEGDFRSR